MDHITVLGAFKIFYKWEKRGLPMEIYLLKAHSWYMGKTRVQI